MMGYYTSTIGSFPLLDSEVNRERCLRDLIELGIDYPAYPQLIDMEKQFLDDLASQNSGIILERGKYRLINREINVDVKPPGLEPFLWTVNYIWRRGLKVKIKAPIIGPFTLASYIRVGDGVSLFDTALSDITLVKQIAQIISETSKVVSRKAEIISIDEPILSIVVGLKIPFKYSESDVISVLNDVRNSCKSVLSGIHVCGRIAPNLANILLRTNMDFLSHEFHDTPNNIRAYSPEEVRKSGKILSVGCLSSRNPIVESVEEILAVMKKFREYGDCIIFTPDCGFRNLIVNGSREEGYKISMRKLKNMVDAAAIFRGEKLFRA